MLRKTPIARMTLAVAGTEMDDTAWEARKRSLLQELKIQLPVLRQLKSSTVQTATELSDTQLLLVVYLTESDQRHFQGLSHGHATDDLYLQDLKRVRDEQSSLHERFQHAVRSTEHPWVAIELQGLRSLLWQARREGRIQLHSSLQGEWLDFPPLPSTFSRSAMTKAEIKVTRLSCNDVGVQMAHPLSCPHTHRLIFEKSRKVSLLRHPRLRDLQSSLWLATLMHEDQTRSVDVEIEYNWIDGQPHRLTLVSMGSTAEGDNSKTIPY